VAVSHRLAIADEMCPEVHNGNTHQRGHKTDGVLGVLGGREKEEKEVLEEREKGGGGGGGGGGGKGGSEGLAEYDAHH
jgi:hypothetical protein